VGGGKKFDRVGSKRFRPSGSRNCRRARSTTSRHGVLICGETLKHRADISVFDAPEPAQAQKNLEIYED